jgi:hypothetical protein
MEPAIHASCQRCKHHNVEYLDTLKPAFCFEGSRNNEVLKGRQKKVGFRFVVRVTGFLGNQSGDTGERELIKPTSLQVIHFVLRIPYAGLYQATESHRDVRRRGPLISYTRFTALRAGMPPFTSRKIPGTHFC